MALPAYQDWAKYRTPSADYIDNGNTGAASDYLGPIVDCSTWSHVMVAIANQDLSATLMASVKWRAYGGSLSSNLNPNVVIGPSQTSNSVLPVRGRSLQLEISNLSGVATIGAPYWVIGMSHPATQYDAKLHNNAMVNDNFAYGPGSLRTIVANYWYEGPVTVSRFSSGGFNAYMEIQYYSYSDLAWLDLAVIGIQQAYNETSQLVSLPAAPMRIVVRNDGAAQGILVVVTPAAPS